MKFEPRITANKREYSAKAALPVKAGITPVLQGDAGLRRNDARVYSGPFVFKRAFKIFGSLLVFFMLAMSAPARADGPTPQAMLLIANVAGECEVLYSMVDFQKKNNIEGGNEYVAKFWAAESTKLGMNVEQLSDRCGRSAAAYEKLRSSASQPQNGGAVNGNE